MRLRALPSFVASVLAGSLLLSCSAAPAEAPVASAPAQPPRLVVAISVDQFAADLFAQYREHYTGGIARLLRGAVFPSAFQSHAATETCPGHSTILTGAHPARTGIVANNWFDPAVSRADKRIYCAEDESDPASTSRDPVVSAAHLRVPTLGEYMKQADPRSRNVAVSAKDRAVMMMGGHVIDAGYWVARGQFVTLNGREPSAAARAANAAMSAAIAKGAPAFTPPAWCAAHDRPVNAGRAGTPGTGRFAMEPKNGDAFRNSPRMDAATLDLALRLVNEEHLGRGAAPDLLSVSLSATDYIGHGFGNQGMEMCIQMAELDRALGQFFARLDASGLDYMVMLTADHGGSDLPERLKEQGQPFAGRADPALEPGALGKAVAAELGLSVEGSLLLGDGPGGELYLSARLPADQRPRVIAALMARLKAHPQVAAAFTREEVAALPAPTGSPQDWTLAERARVGFDPQRSGEIIYFLRRAVLSGTAPVPGYVAGHGSPWDYDRRVPLLFWRKGMTGFEQPAPVETVDIAPTLVAVLGLKVPAGAFDGRCLDLDGMAGTTCR